LPTLPANSSAHTLQRSHGLSTVEGQGQILVRDSQPLASTKPRSFDRGGSLRSRQSPFLFPGFNEATVFRPWRGHCRDSLLRGWFLASTKPRSFDRGGAKLPGVPSNNEGASTKPRSFDRGGNKVRVVFERKAAELQRSHGLSTVEGPPGVTGWICSRGASTKPRSFDRGGFTPQKSVTQSYSMLQRSHGLSTVEGSGVLGHPPPRKRWLQRSHGLSTVEGCHSERRRISDH